MTDGIETEPPADRQHGDKPPFSLLPLFIERACRRVTGKAAQRAGRRTNVQVSRARGGTGCDCGDDDDYAPIPSTTTGDET